MSRSSESPCCVSAGGEIMLFGVRVRVDPMRKSVSMNNLSEYEPVVNEGSNNSEMPKSAAEEGAVGYASADDAVPQQSGGNRERKRGVPWTEEEHKLFLLGLQKVGKGDWRGISRNYVKTRTPTQVASHAQKYFLRRSNINRRRRRSSLFDITTDSVTVMPTKEAKSHEESLVHTPNTVPLSITSNGNGFSVVPFPATVASVLFSAKDQTNMANNSSQTRIHPPLSLQLSLSSGQDQPSTQASAFMMQGFKNEDCTISVT